MKYLKIILPAFLLCTILSSCSKNDADGSANGTMTAKVEGVPFNATVAAGASISSNVLSIAATGADGQINLTIPGYIGAGTYSIGPASNVVAVYTITTSPFTGHTANMVAGSGSITFTEPAAGRVQGTFNFTGYNSTLATFKTITDGSFNIKLQ